MDPQPVPSATVAVPVTSLIKKAYWKGFWIGAAIAGIVLLFIGINIGTEMQCEQLARDAGFPVCAE